MAFGSWLALDGWSTPFTGVAANSEFGGHESGHDLGRAASAVYFNICHPERSVRNPFRLVSFRESGGRAVEGPAFTAKKAGPSTPADASLGMTNGWRQLLGMAEGVLHQEPISKGQEPIA